MFSLIASNGSCVRFLDIDDYGLIKLILEDGIIKAYKGLSRDISGEFEYLKTITLASDIVSFEARSFDGTHFAIIYTTSFSPFIIIFQCKWRKNMQKNRNYLPFSYINYHLNYTPSTGRNP